MSLRDKSKPVIIDILIYLLFAVAIIICLNGKKNLHIDEVFSYGLSNYTHGINPVFEDEVVYEPASVVFDDYMTVSSDSRFNYPNVFKNQADDVHPPLFYIILHTICSLFPGRFSIWYAGIINIVFSMILLFFLRRIIEILVPEDLFFRTTVSLCFVFSAGILSANTFLRMYIMAMALCTAFTYLILKRIKEPEDRYYWVKFAFLLVAGALTHYYCVIYDVLLCIMLGIYDIIYRRRRDIKPLIISSAVSGAISLCVFPAMIKHLFTSSRGKQTIRNVVTVDVLEYFRRLREFFSLISNEIFGGLLILIIVFLIAVIAVMNRKGQGKEFSEFFKTVAVPGIAVLAFFLLIVKWAVFVIDRYMYMIYPALFVLIMSSLYHVVRNLVKKQQIQKIVWIIIAFGIVLGSWKFTHWNYTYWYPDEKSIDQLVENSSDKRAVCIYNESWEIQYIYKDLENLKSVVFIQENNLEEDMDLIEQDCVLYMSEYLLRLDVLSVLERRFPDIDQYLISQTEGGTVFYISN